MTNDSGPPPLPAEKVDEPSRLEVAASIVVPGAGQLLQRRWASAVPQLLVTTILLVIIMHESLMPLYKMLRTLTEQHWAIDEDSIVAPRMKIILLALGAFVMLQIYSIVDAAAGLRRRELAYRQQNRKMTNDE
jgi:hypothetical protein